MENKNILIITYYWPPSGGSGVQRWVYFSKYLKKFGWNPMVLTVSPKKASYRNFDESLSDIVKEIKVTTTNTLEPLKIFSRLTKNSEREGIPSGEINNSNIFLKFFSFVRGNFFIPDARIGWGFYAKKAAANIIKREKIKYLITTGPPHSTHLIGLKLFKNFNLKWIVDFRDPWSEIFYNKDLFRLPISIKRDMNYEKKVLANASAVLTSSDDEFHNLLMNKIKSKQNFYSIKNGFDKELFKTLKYKKSNLFKIVHTGNLTNKQSYKQFINVLLKVSNQYSENFIELIFAGNISKKILNEFQKKLPKIKTKFIGYISHKKSIKLIKDSCLLVNFVYKSAEKLTISGKIYEYMAANSPILCFGDKNSVMGKLLQEGENSLVTDGNNKKIYKFFNNLIVNWKRGRKNSNKFKNIDLYSRENLTKKLVKVLNEI